jgi:hypothetical protein
MGCDINIWTEKRTGGAWTPADRTDPTYVDEDGNRWPEHEPIYSGRNYFLFAVLAGVRNSYDVTPISPPKGLPSDVSLLVASDAEAWRDEGHDFSYLSLEELEAYGWTGLSVTERRWVSADEYRRFTSEGWPRQWWARDPGPGWSEMRRVSNEEMKALIAAGADTANCYTHVEWQVACEDRVSDFRDGVIPKLRDLAGDDPASVRIVFWFSG